MLDDRLQFVQRLVETGFVGLQGVHLGVQRRHLGAVGGGEGGYPLSQQGILTGRIGIGFQEGGNVSRESFAQVVHQTHAHHAAAVHVGELVGHQQRHERQPPAVLRHAFAAAAGGVAVTGGVLQLFRGVQDIQKLGGVHGTCPPVLFSSV